MCRKKMEQVPKVKVHVQVEEKGPAQNKSKLNHFYSNFYFLNFFCHYN